MTARLDFYRASPQAIKALAVGFGKAPSLGNEMRLLFLLVAALPFCDFLQNGFVAFGAPAVMGGIAASPEEYSLAATLYAVCAIFTIALHRLLVEAFGWRRYLLASIACFALGALACARSESVASFSAGRVLMALGCGAFLTAGRVLVQLVPPSPRRLLGLRFFAAGLAWGAVAGPVLASLAVGIADWRTGFHGLAGLAALLALLVARVPELRQAGPGRGPSARARDLGGLALLLGGSWLLLHASAQSAFAFFAEPGWTYAAAAFAVPALALFVCNNAQGSVRLLAVRRIAQRRYLAGLLVFALAYTVIGADNTALPFLLRNALDLPLQVVAADVGLGAMAGVATWIVLARLLPRWPGPWGYYAAACTLLALSATGLARLSESAEVQGVVLPALVCHGAFVILVLATTAMQAFRSLQAEDDAVFSLANQLKNMVAQLGLALGSAAATLLLQWRGAVHYGVLAEGLGRWNAGFEEALARLTSHFAGLHDAGSAAAMAMAVLAQQVRQEALLLAALDYFRLLAWLAAGGAVAAASVLFTRAAARHLGAVSASTSLSIRGPVVPTVR